MYENIKHIIVDINTKDDDIYFNDKDQCFYIMTTVYDASEGIKNLNEMKIVGFHEFKYNPATKVLSPDQLDIENQEFVNFYKNNSTIFAGAIHRALSKYTREQNALHTKSPNETSQEKLNTLNHLITVKESELKNMNEYLSNIKMNKIEVFGMIAEIKKLMQSLNEEDIDDDTLIECNQQLDTLTKSFNSLKSMEDQILKNINIIKDVLNWLKTYTLDVQNN